MAQNLGIDPNVVADPSKFAASQGGVGQDTQNAVQLGGLLNAPLASQGGASISTLHANMVNQISSAASVATTQADSAATYQASLVSQNTAVSGVSIDEETINMLTYQRTYQASARVISTINDLLNTLVNL